MYSSHSASTEENMRSHFPIYYRDRSGYRSTKFRISSFPYVRQYIHPYVPDATKVPATAYRSNSDASLLVQDVSFHLRDAMSDPEVPLKSGLAPSWCQPVPLPAMTNAALLSFNILFLSCLTNLTTRGGVVLTELFHVVPG